MTDNPFDRVSKDNIDSLIQQRINESRDYKAQIVGTGAPTMKPRFIGDTYIDTTNKVVYTAYGPALTDWATPGAYLGDYTWKKINGILTKVYTKFFTGTTGGGYTMVAHGIADIDKIISFNAAVKHGAGYYAYGRNDAVCASWAFTLSYTATHLAIGNLGSAFQHQLFTMKVEYYI